MNVRKLNGPLTHRQVGDILNVWQEAKKAGLPLTAHITQRLPDADRLDPALRMEVLQATINAYCSFARRHKFPAGYVWVREIARDGTGEHFHILAHVPSRLQKLFGRGAEARRPFPEIKATLARDQLGRLSDGRWYSTAAYIAKQMTPQARFKFRIPWERGGKVLGARMGMSRNLKRLMKCF